MDSQSTGSTSQGRVKGMRKRHLNRRERGFNRLGGVHLIRCRKVVSAGSQLGSEARQHAIYQMLPEICEVREAQLPDLTGADAIGRVNSRSGGLKRVEQGVLVAGEVGVANG